MLFARDREKNKDVYGPFEIRNNMALFFGALGLILVLVPFGIRFSMWAEGTEQQARIQEAQQRSEAAEEAYGPYDALAGYSYQTVYFFDEGPLPDGFELAGATEDGGALTVGYVDPERGFDAGQLGIEQSAATMEDVENLRTCLMTPEYFEHYANAYDAECVPVRPDATGSSDTDSEDGLPAGTRAAVLRLGEGGQETLYVYAPEGDVDRVLEVQRPGGTPLPYAPEQVLDAIGSVPKQEAQRRLCERGERCYLSPSIASEG